MNRLLAKLSCNSEAPTVSAAGWLVLTGWMAVVEPEGLERKRPTSASETQTETVDSFQGST